MNEKYLKNEIWFKSILFEYFRNILISNLIKQSHYLQKIKILVINIFY